MNRSLMNITANLPKTSVIALLAAALLATSGVARAQDQRHHSQYTAYTPTYYGWSPNAGTTWQESLLHGYSDLLRAAGQRELLHYEALRSREAAVEHALENSVRRLEVRQTRQMMGLQHRETLRRMERERRAAVHVEITQTEPVDEAAEAEHRAANKLYLARELLEAGVRNAAERYLEDIVRDYAGTTAAGEAEQLLAGL